MRNLNKYIDNKNRWNAIFGHAAMTFPLNQAQVDNLARGIDSELSPENLHCDGEISASEARKKYNYLTTVARELEQYCVNNWLNTPTLYEL